MRHLSTATAPLSAAAFPISAVIPASLKLQFLRGWSWASWSSLLLGLLLWCGSGLKAEAAPPETAPAELTNLIDQVEAAANQRDVQAVINYYSENFASTDDLTRSDLERALTQLWFQYPELTYDTELQSWEQEGDAFVAETLTRINGQRQVNDRTVTLEATIRSRQQYQDGQIVQQEILSEQSQQKSGANPPQVAINLPNQVDIGQEFSFDAIVQEPLGDRLLLGSAIEAEVGPRAYLNPTELNLQLLPAGGLFKVGEAPALPDSRWISAVLIREDGITTVSQRLQIGNRSPQLESAAPVQTSPQR